MPNPETGYHPEGEESRNLFQEMQEKNPDRNAIFTAIEQIKDPEEMRQFYQNYVEVMQKAAEEDPEEFERGITKTPDSRAAGNIGCIIGYYNKKTADEWMKAIPEISNPVFGKDIPWSDIKKDYEAGAGQTEE